MLRVKQVGGSEFEVSPGSDTSLTSRRVFIRHSSGDLRRLSTAKGWCAQIPGLARINQTDISIGERQYPLGISHNTHTHTHRIDTHTPSAYIRVPIFIICSFLLTPILANWRKTDT